MHPAIAVGMVIAIVVGGLGAYLVLRPHHRSTHAATSAATGASSSSTGATHALDEGQIVQALSWTSDDAPAGWSFSPSDTSAARPDDLSLPACGADPSHAPPTAHDDAPAMTNGAFLAVQGVALQRTTETVANDFNAASSGAMLDCIRGEIVDRLGPVLCSCTGITAEAVPLTPPGNAPATTYAFRVAIARYGYVGTQLDAYLIGDGRAEITLLFVAQGSNFPSDVETTLVTTTLQRLHDNPTANKPT